MIPLLVLLASAIEGRELNLSTATVVASERNKPVDLLIEEVESRSQVRWSYAKTAPATGAAIILTAGSGPAEGYRIATAGDRVTIAGNDPRGVMFGAGHLLRSLNWSRGAVTLPVELNVTTAPKYRLRGHQLGYRPKTNSYDGWTLSMWEQYYRDLIVFGTNAVELIPPRSDDDADSPHFPAPPMRMMRDMSKLAADYGIECWIWYPAMDKDYSDPATVEFALKEWAEVFRQLPRVDAVFVPGGDPGHTQPKYLMPLLEKQTASLHKYHPRAQMWVAPQGFTSEWMDEFIELLKPQPAWLTGVVFGPQVRLSLEELRRRVPERYPIRFYPDITHSLRSQYPVPDWDAAFALTLQREPINPRPLDQAAIFKRLQPVAAYGFLTYSEGCNDDVNKFVWSGLGWDPERPVIDILRDYSRYFIGSDIAEGFAQGLMSLEQNWRGAAASNASIDTTLAQFQQMEHAAKPQRLLNWRFQQALYRAYYDAYVRARSLAEQAAEQRAMEALRAARAAGSLAAIVGAERELIPRDPAPQIRQRVFELAEALFQSIRMQLSVPKYQAIAVGRGANLDLIDTPLSNRSWLAARFAAIRAMSSEIDRLQQIEAILDWTNPGPGGFYDDLGDPARQPHLVRPATYAEDPAYLRGGLSSFGPRMNTPMRLSTITYAEAFYEQPLIMQYRGLDRTARYRLRLIYGGDSTPVPIKLVANGNIVVHPFTPKETTLKPVEFDIPQEATANGELRLEWTKTPGLGGPGRGVQISEVWLTRK